ncbi:vesicle-mediated transporter Vid24 [Coccidioides immitis RS]|uniref:Vesicle-mediated transporter Vid24 n=3 Tax=Coccidioides immitis TaxID=5501 RepID=J3K994_COCIM|nr:vesicle-mediated transporter Vid24 [Coccidioides immitis RS]EAS31454.3 vesicle-mediated transporter Vid24 [Coccidioides immitis RS]KMP04103.1 cytoplasmic vesicle protein [Coccidioides immitis RMSCC 2394]KMU80057.1 cytoplasmic vesicle protein [Coccidioides immitis RMSCC 3703]TPX24244.1 hypothetical protein DIZ76_013589 [Coccidioides immitis]
MPTPSVTSPHLASLSLDALSARGTCPPDIVDRADGRNTPTEINPLAHDAYDVPGLIATSELRPELDTPITLQDSSSTDNKDARSDGEHEASSPTTSVSTQSIKDEPPLSPAGSSTVATPSYMTSLSHDFSNVRLLPDHPCSYLRAGSKFVGTQQSDRQKYNVDVEIKNVNMEESFLCGYLRIQGLTEDHPTLTTYFEGELIGTKHKFQTRNPSWGATDKTDLQHWDRFPAWRSVSKMARKPDFTDMNFAQREHIFMRWKEYFLVPDHRVKTINGASFEGFYYICFNQSKGTVSGIYFHAKSEKYQQLELEHVDNRGCFGAMEFR